MSIDLVRKQPAEKKGIWDVKDLNTNYAEMVSAFVVPALDSSSGVLKKFDAEGETRFQNRVLNEFKPYAAEEAARKISGDFVSLIRKFRKNPEDPTLEKDVVQFMSEHWEVLSAARFHRKDAKELKRCIKALEKSVDSIIKREKAKEDGDKYVIYVTLHKLIHEGKKEALDYLKEKGHIDLWNGEYRKIGPLSAVSDLQSIPIQLARDQQDAASRQGRAAEGTDYAYDVSEEKAKEADERKRPKSS